MAVGAFGALRRVRYYARRARQCGRCVGQLRDVAHLGLGREGQHVGKCVGAHLVALLGTDVEAVAYDGEVAGPVASVKATAVASFAFGSHVKHGDHVCTAHACEKHVFAHQRDVGAIHAVTRAVRGGGGRNFRDEVCFATGMVPAQSAQLVVELAQHVQVFTAHREVAGARAGWQCGCDPVVIEQAVGA